MSETPYQRTGRLQRERKAAREKAALRQAAAYREGRRSKFSARERALQRIADRLDGYDRDDLGEGPDY